MKIISNNSNRIKTARIGLRELEKMSADERRRYFGCLRNECRMRRVRKHTCRLIINTIGRVASIVRPYELVIEGTKNIPSDDNVIFLCNHSNAHDMFTVFEIFPRIRRRVTPFVAWDGLNFFSRLFFRLGDSILIERGNSLSIDAGIKDVCAKILKGKDALIFAEGTWNMHPTRLMQNLHAGVTEISAITGKTIVPTIFEYIETDSICKKENAIYKKCVVSFGTPITVSADKSLFGQTESLKEVMESMRDTVRKQENVDKTFESEAAIKLYINHTYLKKYKAAGFTYNTELESKFLLSQGQRVENEYCIDASGKFVPGMLKRTAAW